MTDAVLIQRLKAAMAIRGITVYNLAKRIGLRYELMRRVFNGERKLTAVELLIILNAADLEIGELMKGENRK